MHRPEPVAHAWPVAGGATQVPPSALLLAVHVPALRQRPDAANAVAESFFASLKRELEGIDDFETWEVAHLSVGEYIDGFYNPCRRHSALNYHSPIEFELIQSGKKAA